MGLRVQRDGKWVDAKGANDERQAKTDTTKKKTLKDEVKVTEKKK